MFLFFVIVADVFSPFYLFLYIIYNKHSNLNGWFWSLLQTVGGVDEGLYNGTMWHTPLTRERFYEIVIVNMEVEGESLGMDCKEVSICEGISSNGIQWWCQLCMLDKDLTLSLWDFCYQNLHALAEFAAICFLLSRLCCRIPTNTVC